MNANNDAEDAMKWRMLVDQKEFGDAAIEFVVSYWGDVKYKGYDPEKAWVKALELSDQISD